MDCQTPAAGTFKELPASLLALESESLFILREVVRQFERPALLYSVGKDSSVLLHLARKAFSPARIPFPLLHVDTGFKFQEMYAFRDRAAKEYGFELIVHQNDDAIRQGVNPMDYGTQKCCALLKTQALLQAIEKYKIDAAIGGARRDEERSRAKERVFSFRDRHGQWDPKNQRPELWNLYNGHLNSGESIRVFPLSNWTEADIWLYIYLEKIPVVPLYFSKPREIVQRGQTWIPAEETKLKPGETVITKNARFRTLGCTHCTGAVLSEAASLEQILVEMTQTRTSERTTRVIDHDRDGSMEIKKREGYF